MAKTLVDAALDGESVRAAIITTEADSHPGEQIAEVEIPKWLVDRMGSDHMDDVLHEWRVLMKLAANIHGNLGVHDLEAKKFAAAKQAFLRSVEIRKKIGDAGGDLSALVTDFQNLAVVAEAEEDSTTACEHRREGLRILRALEHIHSNRPEARMWSDAASRAVDELKQSGCDTEGLE
jgi:hypothetical protein